ncbi:hypothetical protein BIW11_11035 [Tropilaelaps mercedesae]|uniref:Uncharacterized protein n=1 Tax=Tropilaelaps mercedesae TaxID=418985 RepID=A0A1V9XDA3_9ACAR|nr:hypothetical protein BIW11_11035 [Tropilaelaps mercedesae]
MDIGMAKESEDEQEEYLYQDIYEEIRQHKDSSGKDQRDEELPDIVTSAYASEEQVQHFIVVRRGRVNRCASDMGTCLRTHIGRAGRFVGPVEKSDSSQEIENF